MSGELSQMRENEWEGYLLILAVICFNYYLVEFRWSLPCVRFASRYVSLLFTILNSILFSISHLSLCSSQLWITILRSLYTCSVCLIYILAGEN